MPSHAYIAATGMITPVGPNTAATHAAVAAGISAYADSNHYNKQSHPMRMALIPEDALPPLNPALNVLGLSYRQQRLLRIAVPALLEAVSKQPLNEPAALFLALPESIPGCDFKTDLNFIAALEIQSGVLLNKAASQIFTSGRAGGFEAIAAAMAYLSQNGNSVALVGGLDTYLDLLLLGILDQNNRILAEQITDGFAPGEAAGFLLVISDQAKKYLPFAPAGIIYPPGIALEPGHRYSDQPYRGEGLANAWSQAIENANIGPIDKIFSSLNGENIGAKEIGVALLRNKNAFAAENKIEHPADCIGDIGAAFAPVLVGLACASNTATRVLHSCSSEQGKRAAAITVSA
ncbi:MAG TPA: hypothetical protein PKD17_01090 [Cellvibrionaceae bacterium]|nr:hypothetical protein [Cellvibrionaceae bacterium]HMW70382.1 hypothetical protein [Cellvibrionaceae bacterium]HMY38272.1 hypothetical protein [Marinagarivorans sp.]HNG58373.1 hypothetical protein [Cellvibrionaceae bacterium]